MTLRLAMAPPLLSQRFRFIAMWYWIHARDCPLAYRARVTTRGYLT